MLVRPQDVTRRGLRPQYTEVTEPVVLIPNNGMVILHVIYLPESTKEGGVVVTVFPDAKYQGDQYGQAQDVVPPGPDGMFIGPFPHDGYTDDETDCFTAHFSAIKGAWISALRISRT